MKNPRNTYLFAIIPVLFFIISFYYKYYAWINYPSGADPEYNYLFNGIILAHLKFHLNAVGHPGTPIQILIAVVGRIVHLFRPGTLWDDVMTNPELYIQAPVYTATAINTLVLFILGMKVFRYTNSAVIAVGMQLTPFAFIMTLEVSCRLMPELIMVSVISAWIIVLVKMLYDDPLNLNLRKYALTLGILYGFSMATKLTFLSFIIIPLLILPNWKLRFRFILFSILAFCVFAVPVISNFNKFISWAVNLFIHKGVYGSGDPGIVDFPYFVNNIKTILAHTYQLWIPLIVLALLVIIFYNKNRTLIQRLTFAIILTVVFHFLITAKHYAFYYLVPSLLMMAFIFFLIYYNLQNQLQLIKQKLSLWVIIFIPVVAIATFNLYKITPQLGNLRERKLMHQEAIHTFKPYLDTDKPKLIVASYYGCSAIEYSLHFGLHESGRYGKKLTAEYKKHYPNSILYFPWADAFYDGVYQLNPEDILKPDMDYVFFMADHSDLMMKRIVNMLRETTGFNPELTLLKEYRPKAEAVYKLRFKR